MEDLIPRDDAGRPLYPVLFVDEMQPFLDASRRLAEEEGIDLVTASWRVWDSGQWKAKEDLLLPLSGGARS